MPFSITLNCHILMLTFFLLGLLGCLFVAILFFEIFIAPQVKTFLVVERHEWSECDTIDNDGQFNILLKVYKWHGRVIWRFEIDRENVPQHAWSNSFTDNPSGWVSKFQPVIDAQLAKQGEMKV